MNYMPKMVDLATLAKCLCTSEAGVREMVEGGEIPGPNKNGRWRWASVDFALSREKEERTSVYFIEMGGFIKIGCTRDLPHRLDVIDRASPYPATLLHQMPGSFDLECDLHRRFQSLRVRGEWYRTDQELLDYIDAKKLG